MSTTRRFWLVIISRTVGYTRTGEKPELEYLEPQRILVEDSIDSVNGEPVYVTVELERTIYFNQRSMLNTQSHTHRLEPITPSAAKALTVNNKA